MQRLGYDRDLSLLPVGGGRFEVRERPAPGWLSVRLDGRDLTVPAGVLLDLGATAKAYAVDQRARRGKGAPMTARLHIDWTACDGRGLCQELLPELLARDEWGYPLPRDRTAEPVVPATN
jgi:hypothetical protein